MGSNAVGLNSSIPLDVKTPPPVDPAEQIGKVMALKNAAVTGQINQAKLTEAQQQIQQNQHSIDARNALALAYKNNIKQDSSGKWNLDQDGYQKDMTAAGFGPEGLTASKPLYDALEAHVKYDTSLLDQNAKKGQMVADLEAPVPRPNFDEPDKNKKAAQIQAFHSRGSSPVLLCCRPNRDQQLFYQLYYGYIQGCINGKSHRFRHHQSFSWLGSLS